MTCSKCNDTGSIGTGNNDLPCDCPAGDKAKFNVAGRGQMTGEQIKDEDRQRRVIKHPYYD